MMVFFLPALAGIVLLLYVIKSSEKAMDRTVGITIVCLAVLCFYLYSFDITGVGLAAIITDLFNKAGTSI